LQFGGQISTNLLSNLPPPSDHWQLDEMVIVIRGKRHWLWRAVDNQGTVRDFWFNPEGT
jgi:putative transposase